MLYSTYLVLFFLLLHGLRFSPGQWDNPHPCSPDTDLLENDLTPANSLWFALGSFLQQGKLHTTQGASQNATLLLKRVRDFLAFSASLE